MQSLHTWLNLACHQLKNGNISRGSKISRKLHLYGYGIIPHGVEKQSLVLSWGTAEVLGASDNDGSQKPYLILGSPSNEGFVGSWA